MAIFKMPTADLSQMTFEETLKKLMKEKDDLEELLELELGLYEEEDLYDDEDLDDELDDD